MCNINSNWLIEMYCTSFEKWIHNKQLIKLNWSNLSKNVVTRPKTRRVHSFGSTLYFTSSVIPVYVWIYSSIYIFFSLERSFSHQLYGLSWPYQCCSGLYEQGRFGWYFIHARHTKVNTKLKTHVLSSGLIFGSMFKMFSKLNKTKVWH